MRRNLAAQGCYLHGQGGGGIPRWGRLEADSLMPLLAVRGSRCGMGGEVGDDLPRYQRNAEGIAVAGERLGCAAKAAFDARHDGRNLITTGTGNSRWGAEGVEP